MPEELTEEVAGGFWQTGAGSTASSGTTGGARPSLRDPRRIGAVPSAEPFAQDISADVALLVEEYRRFLVNERGLAELSIRRYLPAVRVFLAGLPSPVEAGLGLFPPGASTGLPVRDRSAGLRSVPDAKSMVTALRSLLCFLFVTRRIDRELAAGGAHRRQPQAQYPAGAAARPGEALLLGSAIAIPRSAAATSRPDGAGPARAARMRGRRHAAQRHRLAEGDSTVHGEGGLDDRLPLLADVGEALVDYFCTAARQQRRQRRSPDRPRPTAGIAADGVRGVVAHACRRAGIPGSGRTASSHRGEWPLGAGSALPEIGQVLRHRSQSSTATYARSTTAGLAELARPWPGGSRWRSTPGRGDLWRCRPSVSAWRARAAG